MFLFKAIRIILFTPLAFCWHVLAQFLLSPWGLIVPMTLLIALFALQQLQQTPHQLAKFYVQQFETCSEEEIAPLIEALRRIGDAGVTGLVQGLSSSREPVFIACRNVLRNDFEHWQNSDNREHHFLILSEAILRTAAQFSPAAQNESLNFVEQIMQIRADVDTSPESTALRLQTLAKCEQILDQLASVRQQRKVPQQEDVNLQPSTVAALDRRTKQPVLVASNGLPFQPASARMQTADEVLLAEAERNNTLAVPRAERLWAYQKSQQNRSADNRNASSFFGEQESLGLASFTPPSSSPASVEERFAQNVTVLNNNMENPLPVPTEEIPKDQSQDISETYRNRKLSETGGTLGSDTFLTPELQNAPLERVPQLPTTHLMQLLHHPKLPHIESAQKTLTGRDGFQEIHLKLAWRLYHPIPAVRMEIITMLPNTPNIQSSVWLAVLLDDPNDEVRYRTASFLATSPDPLLQRLLIDRGKRDNDSRIVNLADRLDQTQRGIR